MDPEFRTLQELDLEVVREIFNYYILHTTRNYRTRALTMEDLKEILRPGHPRYRSYMICEGGKPCGFVYLSQFRKRGAYGRTAELTVYLKQGYTGRGIGRKTMEFMEGIAREAGISVLVGIIGSENKDSIALFERMGYNQCAHFRRVAEKFGRVLDMVAYQKILDER